MFLPEIDYLVLNLIFETMNEAKCLKPCQIYVQNRSKLGITLKLWKEKKKNTMKVSLYRWNPQLPSFKV